MNPLRVLVFISKITNTNKLTWNPSYVHEANFIIHFCSSNGKNSTLIEQDDLNMAEDNQVTFPSDVTIMFVLSMAVLYWLSALENNQ